MPPRRTKKTMPQTVACGYTIILLDYKYFSIQNVVLLCFIQNLKNSNTLKKEANAS